MDCKSAWRLIPAFLDGELSETQAQHVDEHVRACAACAHELAELRATLSAMSAWQEVESRYTYADFRERAERLRTRPSRVWRFPSWNPAPRWVAAAMLTVALLGGGISGVHHGMQLRPHNHALTADASQVSDSISLDVFGDGLGEALSMPGEVAE